jgi:D-serine deaminase-like pyridoxal phosphate-dependent protein
MLKDLDIRVPTLILDQDRCSRNIERMISKANRSDVILRPHFKTHQSRAVGRWFRERGVKCIATSSLMMARYFASDGWEDITVAFPINVRELDTINFLAKNITLNILVEAPDTVHWLASQLEEEVGVFIKIDVGTHRTGIPIHDIDKVERCLRAVKSCHQMRLKGFLAHAGHTYDTRNAAETKSVYHDAVQGLQQLKLHFEAAGNNLVISYGDTPSCSVIDTFSGIDEARPGNFVFYDLMQHQIGACKPEDIAVAMAVPVVALHPDRGQLVVYGGSVHFGKDAIILQDGSRIYGRMLRATDSSWEASNIPCYLNALSQEHGMVSAPRDFIENLKVGEVLLFSPVHSCQTAQLMGQYTLLDGGKVDHYAGNKK